MLGRVQLALAAAHAAAPETGRSDFSHCRATSDVRTDVGETEGWPREQAEGATQNLAGPCRKTAATCVGDIQQAEGRGAACSLWRLHRTDLF